MPSPQNHPTNSLDKTSGQTQPLGPVIMDLMRWLVLPLAVGQGWLEQFGIAARPDQGDKIDPIARDIGHHIADDAERRHHLDLLGGLGHAAAQPYRNTGNSQPELRAN